MTSLEDLASHHQVDNERFDEWLSAIARAVQRGDSAAITEVVKDATGLDEEDSGQESEAGTADSGNGA